MKCVECATELRPVVSIDIDGTLGDHHGHFSEFVSSYLGTLFTPSGSYPYDVEFSEWLGLDKSTYREIKLAYRQGGMKRLMPVFPGAAETVEALRAMGIDVWIATTRPWLRLDNIDPDTRHWLYRHGIGYDGLVFGDDKYAKLVSLLGDRIIGALDDLPEQFDAAAENGIRPILKKNNHRGIALREPRVHSVGEIIPILENRFYEWQRVTTHTSSILSSRSGQSSS